MKLILRNLIFCLLLCQPAYALQKSDSVQIKKQTQVYIDSAYEYLYTNQKKCIKYCNKGIEFSLKHKNYKGVGGCYNIKGNAYHMQGKYPEAYTCYDRALKYNKRAKFVRGEISSYVNLGYLHTDQQNYRQAHRNIKLGIQKSIEIKDSSNLSNLYNNLAVLYNFEEKTDSSLIYHLKSLEIRQKLKNPARIATSLSNVGTIYYEMKEYEKSLYYHLQALRIDSVNVAPIVYVNLSTSYMQRNDYKKALLYGNKALEYANSGLEKTVLVDLYRDMFQLYFRLNNLSKTYEFAEKALQLKDSLTQTETKRIIAETEEKYESEKKDRAIRQLNKDKVADQTIRNAENARHKVVVISVLIGLLLVVIFSFFLFKRYRESQQQKKIIEHQKHIVEEKQKEVIDSINYAKRLQEAILTPPEVIKKHLPDSFLYYRPKDIVAGDFYFFEISGDTLYIAAADCTGHGVPGAMVSVVCANALTRSVREFKLTDPGKILDKTRDLVLETFSKSESEVKDGMDIALVSLEFEIRDSKFENNLKSQISNLKFAGANNPLLVYKSQTDEFITINADKQPVGLHDRTTPFTTHTVALHKNDAFYLFTDGYPDQFGGDKGKKMKLNGMKNFLYSVRQKNMSQQEYDLASAFETWKGTLEQLDDVCIIGVRI